MIKSIKEDTFKKKKAYLVHNCVCVYLKKGVLLLL